MKKYFIYFIFTFLIGLYLIFNYSGSTSLYGELMLYGNLVFFIFLALFYFLKNKKSN
ncbi:hypothetical protein Calab_1021 [Caldithrix abyssi DSM 13497]|uniref:Uncharacterized protein n=1 Tax=Caldithrix abyssi DSM 13497 TaxID=880073 RepID=H1XVS8_CALAY|nr:hypothetical protein Cabys_4136 [Caldithrix abyssi DSM 13497]EHO40655.1 hypothetical protein Calab_1021 [Caldithrix abyssi DSM 13497]